MLSNIDIQNELGKNLIIYPLRRDNIKGNTINLTASNLAWSLKGGVIKQKKYLDYKLPLKAAKVEQSIAIKPNASIIFERPNNGKQVIVIPPHDTALIETEEVISVTNKIGGTYHSKVGLVSMGTGHIGTTLDPLYTGQSLIAIHNHTDDSLEIEVGSTFVSLILFYLNTDSTYPGTNQHGHVNLLTKLGIALTPEENDVLVMEWKEKWELLKPIFIDTEEYKKLEKERLEAIGRPIYLTKKFIKTVVFPVVVLIVFIMIAPYLYDKYILKDLMMPNFNWVKNVALSGLFVVIIASISKYSFDRYVKENSL